MSDKIKLGVIFGGKSDEHEVSIMSAGSILQHVNKDRYEVYPIGISRDGAWGYLEDTFDAVNANTFDDINFGELLKKIEIQSSTKAIGMLVDQLDVVFPVLHGPYGEDGTIQGLFEMLDIPYVGANVPSSVLCMDKVISKQLLMDAGIRVVGCVDLKRADYDLDKERYHKLIDERFTYPMFVKPANLGSSVGISKVKSKDELQSALLEAFRYDCKILVEPGIDCREVECAVLGNGNPKASVVGEILPSHEFYDYKAKYFDDGQSKLIIPAPITSDMEKEIQVISIKAYKILGITGLSRIDFFVDKKTNAIYLNEINTLPGFTQYSMYPLLWAKSGIEYPDLIDRLIDLAFERKKETINNNYE